MLHKKNTLRILECALLIIAAICFNSEAFAKMSYPDFDYAMLRIGLGLEKTDPNFNLKNKERYEARNPTLVAFFRDMYYRNIEEASNETPSLRIPRTIHQIWLGSPVPAVFRNWMETWSSLQGWEYRLWTDKEIKDLFLYNRTLYDQSTNFGEKSDILRLEILEQFGGVYADVDLECLQPDIFEELHHSFDFYIGFEPLEHGFTNKFNIFKVCNAIIASAPHHPLLKDLIENLKANYLAYKKCCTAVQKTGPSYLTRIICEHELSGVHNKRNMYLPCTFFYPTSEPETRYLFQHPEIPATVAPETAGFHYWYGSWWKNDPFAANSNTIAKIHSHTPGV